MLLALLAPAVLAERALCESWCADVPCAELNGDAASECGACGPASACWPGAIPSKDDAMNDDSCRPANEEVSTEAACAFQRLSASSFHARSPAERARFLQRPTVIEGLIEDWPAMATLAGQQELVSSDVGSLEVSVERVPGLDAGGRELVQLRELHADDWARTHVVLFSDWRTNEARRADAALQPLFRVPSELGTRATGCSCRRSIARRE